MRKSKIMYLFLVLMVVTFMVVGANRFAQAGPPLKAGNPGVPGLLAEIAQLEKTVADQKATIQELLNAMENFAPVPQTGQTVKYYPGDDGYLRKGVPSPDPRFTDHGDGTITDNLTGLIWLKNANCFDQKTWADALSDCNSLESGSCGLTDGSVAGNWSLPNIREIHSLIDYGADNPALPPGNPFTGVVCSSTDCSYGYYWSGTTVPVSLEAYSLYLGGGFVNEVFKSHLGYRVWCVRGGQ